MVLDKSLICVEYVQPHTEPRKQLRTQYLRNKKNLIVLKLNK